VITGGCLCGCVRYEIEGRVSAIWYCHCSKCRKVTGSAFHPGALCRREAFRWTRGEQEISEYRSPSGYTTRFCRRCGSPVPSILPGGESVVLSAGALDQDPGSRPLRHIFAGSRAPWFEITDGLPQFDAHAPGSRRG
jgi:hypothetical protein